MKRTYFILLKSVGDEIGYVSSDDMNCLVFDVSKALKFFSENHVGVWRKCNPNITDTITIKVVETEDRIELISIE